MELASHVLHLLAVLSDTYQRVPHEPPTIVENAHLEHLELREQVSCLFARRGLIRAVTLLCEVKILFGHTVADIALIVERGLCRVRRKNDWRRLIHV